jgi:drug/metabolite transporter (DMT)-like permease
MKILAYTLFLLGLVLMAFSRPLSDHLNAPLMCLGAALGIAGVFMRSRIREGIPILTVTDKDRTQFKQMRREFGLRNVLGRLLATFGALVLLVAVVGPFYSKAERYDWRVSIFAFVFGLTSVLCAKLLMGKSR